LQSEIESCSAINIDDRFVDTANSYLNLVEDYCFAKEYDKGLNSGLCLAEVNETNMSSKGS
jgi:hypothetical protein